MKKFQGYIGWIVVIMIKKLVVLLTIVIVSLVVVDEYYTAKQEEIFFDAMKYVEDSVEYEYNERMRSFGIYEIEDVDVEPSTYNI